MNKPAVGICQWKRRCPNYIPVDTIRFLSIIMLLNALDFKKKKKIAVLHPVLSTALSFRGIDDHIKP